MRLLGVWCAIHLKLSEINNLDCCTTHLCGCGEGLFAFGGVLCRILKLFVNRFFFFGLKDVDALTKSVGSRSL